MNWDHRAEDDLAETWLKSNNREAVSIASRRVDQLLSNDADQMGTELHEGLRGLDVPPIRVLFEAYPDDRRVLVIRVREL